jgi:fibronectin-binding autotransporter adhesin
LAARGAYVVDTLPSAPINNVIPWAITNGNDLVGYTPSSPGSVTGGLGILGNVGFPNYDGTTMGSSSSSNPTQNLKISGSATIPNMSGGTYAANAIVQIHSALAQDLLFANQADTLNLTAGVMSLAVPGGNIPVSIGGTAGSGTLTAGGAQGSGTVPLYLFVNATGAAVTINSVLADNGYGAKTRLVFSAVNQPTYSLAASNTYTGGTVVNGNTTWFPTLNLAATGRLPAGGLTLNGGRFTQTLGGVIDPNNFLQINGNSTATLVGANTLASVAFENSGGSASLNTGGVLSLTGSLSATSQNVGSTPIITGTLDFGGTDRSLLIAPIQVSGVNIAPNQATLRIDAAIQNAGTLTVSGGGVLMLNSGLSTFSGGLTIAGDSGVYFTQNSTGTPVTSGPAGTGLLTLQSGARVLSNNNTIGNPLALGNALTFPGSGNLNFTGAASLAPGSFTFTVTAPQVTAILGGSLSGASVSLVKEGLGTLQLGGNSTYDGGVRINAGVLSVSNDAALGVVPSAFTADNIILNGGALGASSAVTLNANRGILLTADSAILANANVTVPGTISSSGTFSLTILPATGFYVPASQSTYTGPTILTTGANVAVGTSSTGTASGPLGVGTLVLAGGALRASSISPTNPAVLNNSVQVAADSTFPTATGELSLMLSGPVTLQGGTRTLNVGIGQTVAASALVLAGPVGESVAGSGLIKAGAGNLRLTNTNTYTGMTTISDGTVVLDSPTGMAVPGSVTFSGGASLTFNRGEQNGGPAQLPPTAVVTALGTNSMYLNLNNNQVTIAGLSHGSTSNGMAVQNSASTLGMGTLILNTPAGQAFAYTALVRNGTGLGTLALIKRGSGTQSLTGVISSSGGLTVEAGTLSLGGANTLSGTIQLSGGVLELANTTATGSATVNLQGGSLAFSSAVGTNQFTLNGFNGSGQFALNNSAAAPVLLSLGGGNTSSVYTGSITGGGGFSKAGTGTVALLGTNLYTGPTTVSAGTLLTTFSPGFSTPGQLTVAGAANIAFRMGGALGWTETAIGDALSAGSIGATAGFGIDVDSPNSASYATLISGPRNFTKSGAGLLVLGGSHTYSGTTSITGGVLSVGTLDSLGSALAVRLAGTLQLTGGNSEILSKNLVLTGSGAALDVAGAGVLTVDGVTSGAFGLTKMGTGTLVFPGTHTYTGDTLVAAGTLRLGLWNSLAASSFDASGAGSLDFGNLNAVTFGGLKGGSNILLQNSGAFAEPLALTVGAANMANVYSGALSGTGSLSKLGTAVLALSGSNTFTGRTFVSAGTLQIGTGGATGWVTGDILNNATLQFNRSDDVVFENLIFGTGAVVKAGTGTLTFSGAQNYTGTTTVTAGTLVLGSKDSLRMSTLVSSPAVAFSATAGGTFTLGGLNGSASMALQDTAANPIELQIVGGGTTYTGTLSGAGSLTKIGPVNSSLPLTNTSFTLGAAQSYTGATTVAGAVTPFAGTAANALILDFANAAAPASDIISATSPLVFGGSAYSNGGALRLNGKTGVANTQTFNGITVGQGQSFLHLNQGAAASLSVSLGAITRASGGLLDFTLPLSAGTISTSATNTNGILGPWATVSGTASVGSALNWATVSGGTISAYTGHTNITTSGVTLTSNPTSNVQISAGGTATTTSVAVGVTDLNSLMVAASNTAAGTLFIQAGGTLRLGAVGGILVPLGAGNFTISGSGALTAGGADNTPGELVVIDVMTSPQQSTLTITAPIRDNGSGPVSFTIGGLSSKNINGANTYTGGTVIENGRVALGSVQSLGTGPITIKTGGQVFLNAGTLTNNLFLYGSGTTESAAYGAIRADGGLNLAGTLTLVTDAGISNNNGSVFLSGKVTGPGAFLKLGGGTTVLSNTANDYAGGTILTGGVLSVASPLSLGSGALTMGGGQLLVTGSSQFTYGNRITLSTATSFWNITNTAGAQITGTLTGSGGLAKSGAQSLTLSGPIAYTGATTIDQGTLTFANSPTVAGGSLIFGSGTMVATAGSLNLANASATFSGLVAQTNTATPNVITVGAGRTLSINGNVNIGNQSVNGAETRLSVTGGGTLSVVSPGGSFNAGIGPTGFNSAVRSTTDLSGIANFSAYLPGGSFRVQAVGDNVNTRIASLFLSDVSNTITANLLQVGASSTGGTHVLRLGAGSNFLNVNTLSLGNTAGGRDSGQMDFGGATTGTVVLRDANGTGRVAVNIGVGSATTGAPMVNVFDTTQHAADLLLGNVSLSTQATRGGSGLSTFSFDQGILDLTSLTMASRSVASANLMEAVFNIGGGTVLMGSSSGTSITMASSTAVGGTAQAVVNLTGGVTTLAGSILIAGGSGTAIGIVNLAGGTLDLGGNTIFDSLNPGSFNTTAGTLRNVGLISGTAGVTKTGSLTLTLAGTNTFTGLTSVNEGTLVLTGGSAIADANEIFTASGATLQLVSSETLGALNGPGTLALSAGTLTLAGSQTSVLNGNVTGPGALARAGAGTLSLSGDNAFSGGVWLSGGLVQIGSGNALGSGSLTLAGGSLSSDSTTPRTISNPVLAAGNTMLGDSTNNGLLTFAGTSTLTASSTWTLASEVLVSGGLVSQGSAVLTKAGPATLTYTGTLSGSTRVTEGSLVLTSTVALSAGTVQVGAGAVLDLGAFGSGFNLNSGNTLGGAGTILGTLSTQAGSVLVPTAGGTIATLATGSLTLAGELRLRLGSSGTLLQNDLLAVTGDLTLTPNTILTFLDGADSGLGAVAEGTYEIARATGLVLGGTIGLLNRAGQETIQTLIFENSRLLLRAVYDGIVAVWADSLGDRLWATAANWNKATVGINSKSRGRDKAVFGLATAPVTVTLNSPAMMDFKTQLRSLELSSAANTGYTFASNDSRQALWFYAGFSDPAVLVNGGSHSIGVPVVLERKLVLTLNGGSSALAITGSLSANSLVSGEADIGLFKTGEGTLRLSGLNTYTGTTDISAGVVVAASPSALGTGSVRINGGQLVSSTGALSSGSLFFNSGSLTLNTAGSLSVAGAASLGGTVSVAGTVDAAKRGRYTLLNAAATVTGTVLAGALPDTANYYLNLTPNSLDLQRRATMGTLTAAAAAPSIITGGSVAVTASLFNVAPLLSDDLSLSLVALDNLTGGTVASGIGATLSSGTLGGLWFTGTNVGSLQTGSLRAVGVNTTNGSLGATVSVNVYGHAVPQASGGTITLTNVITGYTSLAAGSNSLSLSNTGTYAVNLKTTGTVTSGSVTINNLSGIVAGGSARTLSATLSPGRASGVFTETFALNYADDSTLSGASLDLGTWNISVKGTVYDHASPVFTSGSLTLANVRVGYTTPALSSGSLAVENPRRFPPRNRALRSRAPPPPRAAFRSPTSLRWPRAGRAPSPPRSLRAAAQAP